MYPISPKLRRGQFEQNRILRIFAISRLRCKLGVDFQLNIGQDQDVANKITLGSRIKALRLEARLSQRELASRLAKRLKGFDFTYLSKIENDRLVPSASAILGLAAELNGNSDELLALAGKAPADVGDMLQKSEGARMFFRSALSSGLSEDDWKKLLEDIKKRKKQ
jgi:transcriptional regulator with XRE-family HTH domain